METWWPIIAPLAAVAINVLAQILAVRIGNGRHFLRAVMLGFFIGAAALIVAQTIFPPASHPREAWFIAFFVNLPLYAALSYCFFSFILLGQSSIRIRLYDEIAQQRGGVAIEEIAREYDEPALVRMRLQRLTESGDIIESNGRYFIGRKRFVPFARAIFALKTFILGKGSEFE
jgi:hypothetical protein